MDNLWFTRNKIIHNITTPTIVQFVKRTIETYKEHCKAWTWKIAEITPKWIPPSPEYMFSITFDVAVREQKASHQ